VLLKWICYGCGAILVETAGQNDYSGSIVENEKIVVAIPVWHPGLLDSSEKRKKVTHG
jgi:hypothetical protein